MTEAVLVAAAYARASAEVLAGESAEASAEAVAVLAAALVRRSIGHLVRCSLKSVRLRRKISSWERKNHGSRSTEAIFVINGRRILQRPRESGTSGDDGSRWIHAKCIV